MSKKLSLLTSAIGGAIALGVVGLANSSDATAQVINCPGDSISVAVANAPAGPQIFQINGVCTENVAILRDDIHLQAFNSAVTPSGDGIHGSVSVQGDRISFANLAVTSDTSGAGIFVLGATNVVFNTMTVKNTGTGIAMVVQDGAAVNMFESSLTGDDKGTGVLVVQSSLRVQQGTTITKFRNGMTLTNASAILAGVVIENNTNNGIFADRSSVVIDTGEFKANGNSGISLRSSSARMDDVEIKDNGNWGLFAAETSNVEIRGNTEIKHNVATSPGGRATVGVFRNSSIRFRATSSGAPNIIADHPTGRAISIGQDSWLRQGADGTELKVTSPFEALVLTRKSGADLRGRFDFEGAVAGSDKSFLDLRNGRIEGDVTLKRDSDVHFSDTDGSVTVEGDLVCEDDDSKATLAPGTVITGSNECSEFSKTP